MGPITPPKSFNYEKTFVNEVHPFLLAHDVPAEFAMHFNGAQAHASPHQLKHTTPESDSAHSDSMAIDRIDTTDAPSATKQEPTRDSDGMNTLPSPVSLTASPKGYEGFYFANWDSCVEDDYDNTTTSSDDGKPPIPFPNFYDDVDDTDKAALLLTVPPSDMARDPIATVEYVNFLTAWAGYVESRLAASAVTLLRDNRVADAIDIAQFGVDFLGVDAWDVVAKFYLYADLEGDDIESVKFCLNDVLCALQDDYWNDAMILKNLMERMDLVL